MNKNTATKENVKFQYLRSDEYHKENNGLCITIGTQIVNIDNMSAIMWSCTFKNPKDQFSKEIARDIIVNDFNSGKNKILGFKKGCHTRDVILLKILMSLYIESYELSDDYASFIEILLN